MIGGKSGLRSRVASRGALVTAAFGSIMIRGLAASLLARCVPTSDQVAVQQMLQTVAPTAVRTKSDVLCRSSKFLHL